jgi:hypothetical protein
LSIRNNERKGDNDEPDTPLMLDRELAVREGDVVLGGEESDQANDTSKGEFDKSFSIKPKPPPGRAGPPAARLMPQIERQEVRRG